MPAFRQISRLFKSAPGSGMKPDENPTRERFRRSCGPVQRSVYQPWYFLGPSRRASFESMHEGSLTSRSERSLCPGRTCGRSTIQPYARRDITIAEVVAGIRHIAFECRAGSVQVIVEHRMIEPASLWTIVAISAYISLRLASSRSARALRSRLSNFGLSNLDSLLGALE